MVPVFRPTKVTTPNAAEVGGQVTIIVISLIRA
jgi:hypothetical protein